MPRRRSLFAHSRSLLAFKRSLLAANTLGVSQRCHLSGVCGGCEACFLPLGVFPEGTTTNGLGMITFRTGCFLSDVTVQAVCLRFRSINNFNPTWETIRFSDHLFRTMTQFSNSMDMLLLPPFRPELQQLPSNNAQGAGTPHRGVVAEKARRNADQVQSFMAEAILMRWGGARICKSPQSQQLQMSHAAAVLLQREEGDSVVRGGRAMAEDGGGGGGGAAHAGAVEAWEVQSVGSSEEPESGRNSQTSVCSNSPI